MKIKRNKKEIFRKETPSGGFATWRCFTFFDSHAGLRHALRYSTHEWWTWCWTMNAQQAEVSCPESQPSEIATQAPQEEALLTKRGGTSVIWLHFGFKRSDTEQKTAICKLCNKTIPAPDANTTNLFYHLKKVHEKEYTRIQKIRDKPSCGTAGASCEKKNYSQPKIKQSFAQGTPYEKTSQRHKQITCAISHYICKGMAPVYIVE